MPAEELLALASAGGAALVAAAATDAWNVAKNRFARLLGRGDQSRVAVLEDRLERTRAELETAGPEIARVRLQQQAAWAGRLEDLLTDHPDTAGDVRNLVQMVEAASEVRSAGHVTQHAIASGNAQQAVLGHGSQTNTFGAAPRQGGADA